MDRLRDADTTLVVPNPLDIPPPGSIHDKPGFFVDCDLEAGFLGTPFRAYWANMITECIRNAILKGGLAPEYTDWTQLGVAIEKIADRIARELIQLLVPPMIEEAIGKIEFVQDGGNVTGTIKGGKFTLNAPEGPTIPDTLVQDGGNVSGTISIADGKFTLNAAEGSEPPEFPAIPDGIVAIGSGTSIRPARDGAKQMGWDGSALGVLGSIAANGGVGANGGVVTAMVGEDLPLAPVYKLFAAGTGHDPTPDKYFLECATNSIVANPPGVLKCRIDMTGTAFLANTVIQGADYAEWFEGVPDIPPGVGVVVGEGGVRPFDPARDAAADVIGVVRPRDTRAALIGNAAEDHWAHLYLADAFGAPVWGEARDAEGRTWRTQAVNPAYDPSRPYVPRSRRPEWSLVGLLGQIPLRDDQPLHPRWRRLRPLADGVSLILVR